MLKALFLVLLISDAWQQGNAAQTVEGRLKEVLGLKCKGDFNNCAESIKPKMKLLMRKAIEKQNMTASEDLERISSPELEEMYLGVNSSEQLKPAKPFLSRLGRSMNDLLEDPKPLNLSVVFRNLAITSPGMQFDVKSSADTIYTVTLTSPINTLVSDVTLKNRHKEVYSFDIQADTDEPKIEITIELELVDNDIQVKSCQADIDFKKISIKTEESGMKQLVRIGMVMLNSRKETFLEDSEKKMCEMVEESLNETFKDKEALEEAKQKLAD